MKPKQSPMSNFQIDIEETMNPLSQSRKSSVRESGVPQRPIQPASDEDDLYAPEDVPLLALSKERDISQTADTGASDH